MPSNAYSMALAAQARRAYVEGLLNGLPDVVQAIDQSVRLLLSQVAEPSLVARRRMAVEEMTRLGNPWLNTLLDTLRKAAASGVMPASIAIEVPPGGRRLPFSLVDNAVIENEIVSSRLALAMMERASWEFNDLCSRINLLEANEELPANDLLRPHVIARTITSTWQACGFEPNVWRTLQTVIHDEFSNFIEEAFHETNRWLMEQQVMPEIDLRPFIRRTRSAAPLNAGSGGGSSGGSSGGGDKATFASRFPASRLNSPAQSSLLGNENQARLTESDAASLAHNADHAEAVLARLNRLIGRQLPEFASTAQAGHPRAASAGLSAAISDVQQHLARQFEGTHDAALAPQISNTPQLLEELDQRKRALKEAASSPSERATIEIVALLFQSLLAEEQIPSAVRVWFARLQMPVLRVAVSEPDFFATIDHPARRLIDRMGACVMGFDSLATPATDVVEKEIKRVVQVVEAYPDTGRRVFQTVLTEFEKFLEHYFRNENEASRKGVSLAQQVEQRETLAIQYTIELRKMLNEVPVQEGVREFLFHVWADVLAMTAVKDGINSDATRQMKRAAADLIWSASAKVSRDERAEVIRRLPPLLKTLRDGMSHAGVNQAKQDEHIQGLNDSLAAAFTARAAAIPHDRLEHLMARLETLEEMLPDADEVEIDESLVLDLSGHENSELEVVADGGSVPTPAMLAWARELQVGSWYKLDYRNQNESVQLAWQGLRRQLTLFVSPAGRGILFQQQRLAAFLQAGLLLPAQDESLTVRATRTAMEKLDADPQRLLA